MQRPGFGNDILLKDISKIWLFGENDRQVWCKAKTSLPYSSYEAWWWKCSILGLLHWLGDSAVYRH